MIEKKAYQQEEELIENFHAGKQEAFTHIYEQFFERLFWYGRKYLEDHMEVEDTLTEAFLQLWEHRKEFNSLSSLSAFMHVAVRNRCFNLLKRRQMQSAKHQALLELLQTEEPGDFYIEEVRIQLLQKIMAAVNELPAKMKEIFLLSYQEGLKPAEIAEKLQLKVQTVSNQKINAIKILKTALGEQLLLTGLLLLINNA